MKSHVPLPHSYFLENSKKNITKIISKLNKLNDRGTTTLVLNWIFSHFGLRWVGSIRWLIVTLVEWPHVRFCTPLQIKAKINLSNLFVNRHVNAKSM
jgi:hypothetical protein